MSRSVRSFVGTAAVSLATLAACADPAALSGPDRSPTPGSGPSLAASAATGQYPELQPTRHIMHTRDFNPDAAGNAQGNAGGGGGSTGMVYHGGRVITSGAAVVAIYWASSPIYAGGPAAGTTGSGAQDGSLVGHFLRNLGGSPYYNINSTYYDGSGTRIQNAVAYTGFWANGTNAPSGTTSVTDAQMVAMLQSGFDAGRLTYDANTIYAIFSAGKVNLGGNFGTQYCAYHTTGTVTINGVARTVIYAAMPYDWAYPSACAAITGNGPNGDPGADAEVNTLAHEIEEAHTDPYLNAWYDRRGYENADKCAWTFGTMYATNGSTANMNLGGRNFLVQRNWVNAGAGGCALAY